jgi:ribonuclease BN (tRNA processing enzyme)
LELTVLGSSGTWPPAGGATCGYLVRHEGFNLWLDAGTGTFANLQRHIEVKDLGAILITHGHSDHFVDMIPCFYALHYGHLGAPGIPFYSPKGFVDLAALLVSEDGRDVMRQTYAFNTLHPGDVLEIGPLRVTVYQMTHIGVESLGYRIEAGGAVFAYTGDTGPAPEVAELAHGADLFLAEATYQDDMGLRPFHMSATQAAEYAVGAGVGRLMLTHLLPGKDPDVSCAQAAAVYDGLVDVATQGQKIVIGRDPR